MPDGEPEIRVERVPSIFAEYPELLEAAARARARLVEALGGGPEAEEYLDAEEACQLHLLLHGVVGQEQAERYRLAVYRLRRRNELAALPRLRRWARRLRHAL